MSHVMASLNSIEKKTYTHIHTYTQMHIEVTEIPSSLRSYCFILGNKFGRGSKTDLLSCKKFLIKHLLQCSKCLPYIYHMLKFGVTPNTLLIYC